MAFESGKAHVSEDPREVHQLKHVINFKREIMS